MLHFWQGRTTLTLHEARIIGLHEALHAQYQGKTVSFWPCHLEGTPDDVWVVDMMIDGSFVRIAGAELPRNSAGPAPTPIEMVTPTQDERGTTDLEKIRMRLAAGVDPVFTMGKVVRVHDAGKNSVVEFTVLGDRSEQEGTWYYPYRKGKELHRSFRDLDAALVYAISSGHNPTDADSMAKAAFRVLNISL